ncbi:MAG: hypothetical protein HFE66_05010 [Clostridiales bacterium]|jgi:hypothetical protein|nr:hypothetical protein [Clostridiales bacterium]
MKRILSVFLSLITVFGAVVVTGYTSVIDTAAAYEDKVDEEGNPVINYITKAYTSPEAKLRDMVLAREQGDYQLWIEEFTGEVAFVDTKTGDTLFSNPYDVAAGYNWASASTKERLLSQLAITYEENSVEKTMYSYKEAALRGQINFKNIKNGLRVEYTVGELMTTRLVPRMISKTRFESMILDKIPEGIYKEKLLSFYTLYDTSDVSLTERNVKEIQAAFPITKQFAVYICDVEIVSKELEDLETIIKAYCPTYTFEEMDQDHADCDYTNTDKAPANFKMAIEYTFTDTGIQARLPANGIQFDEANFVLKSITMLPFMGCGSSQNTGYTFIPDGSGTLIRFEDVFGTNYNVAGQMYGADYAYHTISGQHSETMRMPVFGVVEDKSGADEGATNPGQASDELDSYSRGYLAIISDGDSMANLMSEHGGKLHSYNNVYASFNPRPSDTYNLADSISVGTNASWTVTTDRKYSGSYTINYVLLTDEAKASAAGKDKFYEPSYVGMAAAYRDYLEDNEIITPLGADDIAEDLPLYLETFGSIKTTERVLSFPVTVDTALTTFDDIETIYEELSEEGVSNINFRLTGSYNGGLDNTYPSKLSWVKELGGKSGFKKLLASSKEKDFGVYPDFDFAYMKSEDWFDGVWEKRDLVKSIDDRYMSKREYDAAMQSFESDYALAISSSVYDYFYDKFDKDYSKYDPASISVSTLGKDLNSDFDEDEPYNREDSKKFTTQLLEKLSEKYDVMLDGGNAYVLPYADHILDIPTESSNFLRASESVPFVSMVLHGYVNYTGGALNMEGDVQYSLLKAIENGASLYFVLSYQNTNALKESDTYNKFYSVAYDVWKDDMIKYYDIVNEALRDLQTTQIVDHAFMDAFRIVEKDETEDVSSVDKESEAKKAAEEERLRLRAELEAQRTGGTPNYSGSSSGSTSSGSSSGADTQRYETVTGSVVRVEYDNGTNFIINYNSYDVTVEYGGETYEVEALNFVRIDG